MKALKVIPKKPSKNERERQVLLVLVDYYIKTGRPVGSNTLKELGFTTLSSATIRNYFTRLEDEGFLIQQHASGGRLPTSKALRLYALDCLDSPEKGASAPLNIDLLPSANTREIARFYHWPAHSADRSHALRMYFDYRLWRSGH
jgi:heat-inducible transcriptional repressor